MAELPFRLPPLGAVLLRSRAEALSALAGAGWRPWATPIDLDAERRRLLNVDLTEPEVMVRDPEGGTVAVAHLEADLEGKVVLLEVTGVAPVKPALLAEALLPGAGQPQVSGSAEARQWIWGPEAGNGGTVGGEPVRLWVCAERAYGDRLWAVASVVRRATGDDGD
jgi:hypothetical protein